MEKQARFPRKIEAVILIIGVFFITPFNIGGTFAAYAKDVSSPVTLEVDTAQISVSIPTTIPLALKSDGTLIAPSAVELTNTSVYPVQVSALAITPAAGITLIDQAASNSCLAPDALWSTITPSGKRSLEAADYLSQKTVPSGEWNLEKAGSPHATLITTVAGHMKNIEQNFANTHKVFDVVWTISAGNAPSV
ncbi:MAG: hypothetical protein RR360_04460 [Raoultibacter sp.]